jgi:hypothetical protein
MVFSPFGAHLTCARPACQYLSPHQAIKAPCTAIKFCKNPCAEFVGMYNARQQKQKANEAGTSLALFFWRKMETAEQVSEAGRPCNLFSGRVKLCSQYSLARLFSSVNINP